MRIVIAGAGSVGRYMARQLSRAGHTVDLIDNDTRAVARAESQSFPFQVLLGDACEVETLEKAGVREADVLAAVTGDDEDNLVISLLAKQEFGVPRVVGRVNNPDNEWMFNDMWGVDVSVSTPHLLTALVEEAVSVGSFVRLLSLEHGHCQLAEVTLAPTSPAVERSISSLPFPREASIVAVVRDGHVVAPHGELVLKADDEVLVLMIAEAEPAVEVVLVGRTS